MDKTHYPTIFAQIYTFFSTPRLHATPKIMLAATNRADRPNKPYKPPPLSDLLALFDLFILSKSALPRAIKLLKSFIIPTLYATFVKGCGPCRSPDQPISLFILIIYYHLSWLRHLHPKWPASWPLSRNASPTMPTSTDAQASPSSGGFFSSPLW